MAMTPSVILRQLSIHAKWPTGITYWSYCFHSKQPVTGYNDKKSQPFIYMQRKGASSTTQWCWEYNLHRCYVGKSMVCRLGLAPKMILIYTDKHVHRGVLLESVTIIGDKSPWVRKLVTICQYQWPSVLASTTVFPEMWVLVTITSMNSPSVATWVLQTPHIMWSRVELIMLYFKSSNDEYLLSLFHHLLAPVASLARPSPSPSRSSLPMPLTTSRPKSRKRKHAFPCWCPLPALSPIAPYQQYVIFAGPLEGDHTLPNYNIQKDKEGSVYV